MRVAIESGLLKSIQPKGGGINSERSHWHVPVDRTTIGDIVKVLSGFSLLPEVFGALWVLLGNLVLEASHDPGPRASFA